MQDPALGFCVTWLDQDLMSQVLCITWNVVFDLEFMMFGGLSLKVESVLQREISPSQREHLKDLSASQRLGIGVLGNGEALFKFVLISTS